MIYDESILKIRRNDSYNNDTVKALYLLAINPDIQSIYGSASYRMQLYPGDVDANEFVNNNTPKDLSILSMTKNLQQIISKIINTDGYYVSEIKVGVDKIFENLKIGHLKYTPKKIKIIDYDEDVLNNQIDELYNNYYLTKNEYSEIKKYLVPNISVDNYNILSEILRNKLILRWSPEEILKGIKKLSPNRYKSLYDSLYDKTMVKIDMLAPINGKYIEVTNFFILQYVNRKGETHNINIPDDFLLNIMNSLKSEVQKLYFNKLFFNPLKMSKRLWSMARLKKDMKMINKITPLLRSDASLIAQINSELETVLLLFKKFDNLPLGYIYNQLNNLKPRLSSLIEIEIDEEYIFSTLDKITNNNFNTEKIIKYLEKIKKELKQKMIEYTIIYLKSKKIFPPPNKYLY